MFKAGKLLAWCKDNCEVWETNEDGFHTSYGYKFSWYDSEQHKNFEVRLFKHDDGFWIIFASCAGGYSNFRCVNMGSVYKTKQVKDIINALGGFSDNKKGGKMKTRCCRKLCKANDHGICKTNNAECESRILPEIKSGFCIDGCRSFNGKCRMETSGFVREECPEDNEKCGLWSIEGSHL